MFYLPKLKEIARPTFARTNEILEMAEERDLSMQEIKELLFCEKANWEKIIKTANEIKQRLFGKKIYFYVPLYFNNYCTNDCLYCDFRKSNKNCLRKKLNFDEFKKEIDYLHKQGYTKIELVSSTDPSFPIETLVEFVKYVKSLGKGWVLMNNRPLALDEYKVLKKAGLDWSWLWMESYDKDFYGKYHPKGTEKMNFEARLKSYDTMAQAGLNVGIAFLMGLSPNWQFEILSTIAHGQYLKEKYNIEIEFGTPRFCPPRFAPLKKAPFLETITDDKFRLMIALYRLAIRDCWINVSTREDIKMLRKLWLGGGNLTNPEAQTIPGGYALKSKGAQFTHYSYDVSLFVSEIKKLGLEPVL